MTRNPIDAVYAAFLTPAYGAPGPTCEANRTDGYYTVAALAPWMPSARKPTIRQQEPMTPIRASLLRFG